MIFEENVHIYDSLDEKDMKNVHIFSEKGALSLESQGIGVYTFFNLEGIR